MEEKKEKSGRGGARPGAGMKKGTSLVDEHRAGYTINVLPSVMEPFRKRYGRLSARRIEELLSQDNAAN